MVRDVRGWLEGKKRTRERNRVEQNRVKNGCDTTKPISRPGYKNSGLLTQQNSGPNSIYHFRVSFLYHSFFPTVSSLLLFHYLSPDIFFLVLLLQNCITQLNVTGSQCMVNCSEQLLYIIIIVMYVTVQTEFGNSVYRTEHNL